jgi:hypothetical protein
MKWILVLFSLFYFNVLGNPGTEVYVDPDAIKMVKFRAYLNEYPEPEMTHENFYLYLIHAGIKHPDIVFCQAILESGYFNSYLYKTCNNPFGMGNPKIRPTTSIGSYKGFAVYSHWTKAIDDMKLWQDSKLHLNQEDYFTFLKVSNYAEDHLYVSKLRKIKSKMEKVISSSEVKIEQESKHKLHVTQPDLNAMDLVRIKIYAEANGYECIIKDKKALVIKDGQPGFIQKHKDVLMAVFKDGSYDNVGKFATVSMVLNQFKVFDIDGDVQFNPEGFFALTSKLKPRCRTS